MRQQTKPATLKTAILLAEKEVQIQKSINLCVTQNQQEA